jgi:hypothetical protein
MNLNVLHYALDVDFPRDTVQMLLYQPFIEFELPLSEPFRLKSSKINTHLENIQRVVDCAVSTRPNFIVLPEYSVPGLRGIELLQNSIASDDFPSNTVMIAGIDGMAKHEYTTAMTLLGNSDINSSDKIKDNEWVNCSITWVKSTSGELMAWAQPKIEAAWPEENTHHLQMFRGDTINLFQASFDNSVPCRFASLLCFDWVGKNGTLGQSVPQRFLTRLNSDWSRDQKKLHWLFLLQHNEKPNHYTFTTATRNFLTDRASYPCVDCSQAALVCVSTAGSPRPSRLGTHGFTSIVFAPGVPFTTNSVCPPTITCKAKNLDASRDLGTCQDYVCREMGECIHRCNVRVPCFVTPDPTDRTLAVTGEVHSLHSVAADPRIPNGPVSAAVKWINDQLDCSSSSLSERFFSAASFKERVQNAEMDITERYRRLPGQVAEKVIQYSTPQCAPSIDDWTGKEQQSLAHIRDSLTLCSAGVGLNTDAATFHAFCETKGVELLAIRSTNHEACRTHFDTKCPQPHCAVLLISRDEDNTRVSEPELKKFYEKERGTGIKAIDYQSLLQACQNAADEATLIQELENLVTIDEPTFI